MAVPAYSALSAMSLAELSDLMIEQTPQNRALRLRLLEVDEARLVMDFPWQAQLQADTHSGAIYEGAITTLIDTACGSVILTLLREFRRPATLDLRVDYRRASRRDAAIRCVAHCEYLSDHLGLVQARAYDGDSDDEANLIATATGSFAIFKSAAERIANAAREARV